MTTSLAVIVGGPAQPRKLLNDWERQASLTAAFDEEEKAKERRLSATSLWRVDWRIALLVLFALDRVVDFLAVYGDFLRRFNAQAHLVTPDLDHHHGDVVTDDDFLVLLAA